MILVKSDAYVIGTGSAESESYIRSLGADEFINYKRQKFEDVVSGLDLVVETIAGDTQERSFQVVKRGGRRVSTLTPPDKERAAAAGITGTVFGAQANASQLTEIALGRPGQVAGGSTHNHASTRFQQAF